jgi:hydrogenase expression/formation protein HypC
MGTESTTTQHALAWESLACTLDHDGCVVCSDAGIPLRIVELQGEDALCEDSAGNQTTIAVELVAPVAAGDIVLTHGGVAIGRADLLYGMGEDSCEVRQ